LILAVDTSTSFVSIGLKDEKNSLNITYKGSEKHAVSLPKLVSMGLSAFKKTMKDVKALGVGIGPGTLTGIRVGAGFIMGVAASLNLDVATFDSLYAIAKGVEGFKNIAVLRKARKGWVYYEIFDENHKSVKGPDVGKIEEVKDILKKYDGIVLVGDGKEYFDGMKLSDNFDCPRPGIILDITENGKAIPYYEIEPLYIQKSIAEINWERRLKSERK